MKYSTEKLSGLFAVLELLQGKEVVEDAKFPPEFYDGLTWDADKSNFVMLSDGTILGCNATYEGPLSEVTPGEGTRIVWYKVTPRGD